MTNLKAQTLEERAFDVASYFDLDSTPVKAERYGSGHINDTFKITCDNKNVIMQRINTYVFSKPVELMSNLQLVTEFLAIKIKNSHGNPERETVQLYKTKDNSHFYVDEIGDYWRCTIFIEDATGYDIISNSNQMYTGGNAFGSFQKLLSDFPVDKLFETIPDFHNTPKRLETLKTAISNNKANRVKMVSNEIEFVLKREEEAYKIQDALDKKKIPLRVTHNDTKLNNVLIDDATAEAVCVIDLDTVMPGAAIYDFGDSIRSGTNSAAEDEQDLSRVYMNMDFYEKFTEGYLSEAKKFLTPIEIENLAFSAKLMTYECGMRFLTDYLDGDVYFKTTHENHNLDRCRTQFKLVADMEANMNKMENIIKKYL